MHERGAVGAIFGDKVEVQRLCDGCTCEFCIRGVVMRRARLRKVSQTFEPKQVETRPLCHGNRARG